MQRLEVSGAVRPIYRSLGVKGLIHMLPKVFYIWDFNTTNREQLLSCTDAQETFAHSV